MSVAKSSSVPGAPIEADRVAEPRGVDLSAGSVRLVAKQGSPAERPPPRRHCRSSRRGHRAHRRVRSGACGTSGCRPPEDRSRRRRDRSSPGRRRAPTRRGSKRVIRLPSATKSWSPRISRPWGRSRPAIKTRCPSGRPSSVAVGEHEPDFARSGLADEQVARGREAEHAGIRETFGPEGDVMALGSAGCAPGRSPGAGASMPRPKSMWARSAFHDHLVGQQEMAGPQTEDRQNDYRDSDLAHRLLRSARSGDWAREGIAGRAVGRGRPGCPKELGKRPFFPKGVLTKALV